ncbi:MAG TPA: hypothetical protein DCZ95_17040 [Verrucomicrobia bacterium]|nr:MAG: hypothetical protein A2X46_09525 [Lentisphaerae bacterium GWF2_57_35]HBA85791.1 hypothetical protein [Verrucomicrobiota bacterium]
MKQTISRLLALCRKPEQEDGRLREAAWPDCMIYGLIVVLGAGIYGATIGLWRAPLQAAYVFVKFPLLLLATTGANALLNGMLAQLMGAPMSFRQSTHLILAASAVFALILASLSPATLFILWNTPPLAANNAVLSHNFILLLHVAIIAFAGVAAHGRLYCYLRAICPTRHMAAGVLGAWLAGNLFLGGQLSWILRPFIGSPKLPVEFFRSDAFSGNFYESVWRALVRLLGS